jgi:hypothetical protein
VETKPVLASMYASRSARWCLSCAYFPDRLGVYAELVAKDEPNVSKIPTPTTCRFWVPRGQIPVAELDEKHLIGVRILHPPKVPETL